MGPAAAEAGSIEGYVARTGKTRSHHIRDVQYFAGDDRFADILLAESSQGIFSPLMKWSGQMLPAEFYRSAERQFMVVIERDLRGSQSYWAWVDTPLGPLRLKVNAAQWAAIQKVDPKGAWGYGPDFDWQRLYWQMSTESGVVARLVRSRKWGADSGPGGTARFSGPDGQPMGEITRQRATPKGAALRHYIPLRTRAWSSSRPDRSPESGRCRPACWTGSWSRRTSWFRFRLSRAW